MRRRVVATRAGLAAAGLAALAFGATPAFACTEAAQAARDDLAAHPDHSDSREALARDCARAGRLAEALAHYDTLLVLDGDNVDWLLGRAQALLALDRPSEALPSLERARRKAPGYEDLWLASATAHERSGDYAATDAFLAEAERALPEASWPATRRAALRRQRLLERGTRLSLALAREELSGDRPAWQSATILFDRPLTGTRRMLAGAHVEERFDAQDEQFTVALVDRIGRNWSWGVTLDAAADAEILPEWNLVAEIGRLLPGDRNVGLRLRHASYSAVDVDSLAATVEQYFGAYRAGYTITASKPTGISARFGHVLRLARDYGDASHATLALGYGEEAETIAPGVVQVTRNESVSLNGVHWRSAAWGLSWEAGWYRQGDLYDRARIRLGLEHRF